MGIVRASKDKNYAAAQGAENSPSSLSGMSSSSRAPVAGGMLLDASRGTKCPRVWCQKRALRPSPEFQELALPGAARPASFRSTRNRGDFTYFALSTNVYFKRGLWRCGEHERQNAIAIAGALMPYSLHSR